MFKFPLFSRRKQLSKPLIFVHIPKTAGTSFRAALVDALGSEKVCVDYRGQSKLLDPIVRTHVPATEANRAFREAFDAERFSALSGHYPARRYINSFDASHFVGFVRDPVSRLKSLYKHKCRVEKLEQSFENFLKENKFQNIQSKLLEGTPWPAYAMLGITERYAESLKCVNKEFKSDFRMLVENSSPRDASVCVKLSSTELQEIITKNQRDVQLFQAANTYLDTRLDCYQRGVPFIKGCYFIDNERSFKGWLIDDGSTNELELDVSALNESDYSISVSEKQLQEGTKVIEFFGKIKNGLEQGEIGILVKNTSQPLLSVDERTASCIPC